MKSIHRSAPALAIASLVLIMPSLLQAENRRHSMELGGTMNFHRFDSDAGIESEYGPTAIAGFNFTKRHGIEATYATFTGASDDVPFEVNVDIITLGYTFNAYPRERIVSFFRSGVGMMVVDAKSDKPEASQIDSDGRNPLLYGGAGIRFFVNDNVAIRLDAALLFVEIEDGFVKPDVHGTIGLGAVVLIGGSDPAPGADD